MTDSQRAMSESQEILGAVIGIGGYSGAASRFPSPHMGDAVPSDPHPPGQSSLLFFVITKLGSRTLQTTQYFFAAPREAVHIPHTVHTRIAPPGCCGARELLVHRGRAKHRVPVVESHRIPLERTGRTLPILARVISLEESIPESLHFGAPFCTFQ